MGSLWAIYIATHVAVYDYEGPPLVQEITSALIWEMTMVQVMFENHPPVEEGFLRCATVQSEAMLAKLLSEGTYQPSRSELSSHSMTAGCPKCENDAQWCWHEAYTWMYEQCAERLNMPEMDAGVWFYAHDEGIHNFKEAYNHGIGKEGMVLLIVDIPRDRIVQSDWILFHRVQQNYPVRSSESLRVDCDLNENSHLIDEWLDWHNNSGLSEGERELRKQQSWQIIFENDRWPEGVYDDAMGNSDASIVQGIAPYVTIDDLVDVIFQTEYNTWDFLMKGEHMRIYGTLEGLSILFLTSKGITSKRIGLKSNSAMFGHQREPTRRKSQKGRVHRKKYFKKKKTTQHLKMRSGNNSRSAELIVRRN